MSKEAKISHSIIAVARDDARFKAVELRRRDGAVEVVWTRSQPAEGRTWADFAAECGFTAGAEGAVGMRWQRPAWTKESRWEVHSVISSAAKHSRDIWSRIRHIASRGQISGAGSPLRPSASGRDDKEQEGIGIRHPTPTAPGAEGRARTHKRHVDFVVGLDAAGVVFYRISAPAVGEEETAAIVRMQAESLLPLPAEQIEVAWRATPSRNGKVDVTIAAARKEYLQKFAGGVRDFRPRDILLSCEGTARAWQSFFSDRQRQAMVVSISAENTQICLARDGWVTHAAILDTGMADLTVPDDRAEPGEITGRFAQDLRAVLGSFGWDEAGGGPVYVLSDGRGAIERIVRSLNAAGLDAKAAVPEARGLRTPAGFETADLYEYRVPLGLALVALDEPSGTLDLFRGIKGEQEKTGSARHSLIRAGVIAVAMLIALIVVWRSVDVALAERLNRQVTDPKFEAARQHQALIKTVARHRPDVLQLLTDINAGQNDGIVLDSLHFKKGQAVSITGRAGNADQMYKFQTGLLGQKGVTDVEISNSAVETKSKKIKFTITFHYRGFTEKEAIL